ncbi:unnamed protein product [Dicrocoelium dendriticum]|nr:unnamed protein product [Dicrocoelium dendriticum]
MNGYHNSCCHDCNTCGNITMLSTVTDKSRPQIYEEIPKGRRHFAKAHLRTSLFGSENEDQEPNIASECLKKCWSTSKANHFESSNVANVKESEETNSPEMQQKHQAGTKDYKRSLKFANLDSSDNDDEFVANQMNGLTGSQNTALTESKVKAIESPSSNISSKGEYKHCYLPWNQNQAENLSALRSPHNDLDQASQLRATEIKNFDDGDLIEQATLRAKRREWERNRSKVSNDDVLVSMETKKKTYVPLQAPWYTDPSEEFGGTTLQRASLTHRLDSQTNTTNGNSRHQADSPRRIKERTELERSVVAVSSLPAVPYAQHY